jgi:hypothetical protein
MSAGRLVRSDNSAGVSGVLPLDKKMRNTASTSEVEAKSTWVMGIQCATRMCCKPSTTLTSAVTGSTESNNKSESRSAKICWCSGQSKLCRKTRQLLSCCFHQVKSIWKGVFTVGFTRLKCFCSKLIGLPPLPGGQSVENKGHQRVDTSI